jgi:MerR family transcriptional regulator/heat shock protein HspR
VELMPRHTEHEGVYSIGVISRLTGMHEQTIRQYERLGLILPKRSAGGTRSYSEHDLQRLQLINTLTRDMGVNLAGVELILRLRDREAQLLGLARELFAALDDAARTRFEQHLRGEEPGLVHVPRSGIMPAEVTRPARKRKIEVQGE